MEFAFCVYSLSKKLWASRISSEVNKEVNEEEGGVRIHPENARMSGRHRIQYVAQCVACAALALVFWE